MKKISNSKAKILLFDIETSPIKAYIWGLWTENRSADFIIEDWFVLCWAAKWFDKREMLSASLFDDKNYKKEPHNDKNILQGLRDLLDESDIVIGHNLDKFDVKKVNARFLYHGITPPSPYKTIDTCLLARKHFGFTSNKLDDLCQHLGLGKKAQTGGFDLWKRCLKGDPKAWAKMLKYNKKDVVLLEKIYLKIRPYIKNHPNLGVYIDEDRASCVNCGSFRIQYRGYATTKVSKFRRFQCQECGTWSRERVNILDKNKKKSLATSIAN